MEFDVLALITEQLLPLTVALIVIGFIVKQIPGIPNWTIPAALTLVGTVGAMAILGWTVSAALKGIIAAGLAVYGNQFWKQIVYESGGDDAAGGGIAYGRKAGAFGPPTFYVFGLKIFIRKQYEK